MRAARNSFTSPVERRLRFACLAAPLAGVGTNDGPAMVSGVLGVRLPDPAQRPVTHAKKGEIFPAFGRVPAA